MYRIVREVAVGHSGDATYSAVAVDPPDEMATGPSYAARFGLCFGLVLFSQASRHLGSVLRLMQRRDPAAFAEVFGPDAEGLLETTGAASAEQRLRPVGGEPLWSDRWVERFRQAGTLSPCQSAQNEEAIEGQFRPLLRVANALGFRSDRGLAMVYECVVSRGLGGGLRWIVEATGPLRTAAQRERAVETLRYPDLRTFQAAAVWVPQDGHFGPETHAALVEALRREGGTPLPTSIDLMGRLVAAASGPARSRLLRLRDSAAFSDVSYPDRVD
jgi:hypothetical protein